MIRTVFTRALQSTRFASAARTVTIKQCNIPAAPVLISFNVANTNNSIRFFSDESGDGAPEGKGAGAVKWFDVKKGFGFIAPSDGSPDIFVHHSVVHAQGFRSLADGEEVEFEKGVDDSGRIFATSVTGPDGDYVKGAPRQFNNNNFGDSGFGGGGGGGGFDGGDSGFGGNSGGGRGDDRW
mmetsp:Transcript_7968/g.9313  ORF Transcript_7968/g.9313 Transcript_7968/m.9313 type:complete len:181 (+) Transcript_7968:132-674(+)|eukprot:CAMPEP_0171321904 /NCGR_PEP_ID=MMETSP0816-20121228/114635_1 /TAXON_ID=420281 /ORGANISM="Proboscia inermis, Strain CCAP1064/1" /LENGTH=180 /DNA_ID=CAMNT_0011820269 /DNA_START=101 /DNA_END=643 /DNA_ORIENTATION=+